MIAAPHVLGSEFQLFLLCTNLKCTQRCLIKAEINYRFRPNVAIIRFSSESIVVVLYRIGMGMSRWWDFCICDICCMLFLRDKGGGSVICAILECTAQVCLLAAVLCGFPATVCPFPMSTAGGLFLWVLWRGEKSKNKSWFGLVCVGRWLVWQVVIKW